MKVFKTLVIIVILVVGIPMLGFLGWFIVKKGFKLEVMVVNKSMIDYKGSENKAINYVLNSEKIFTAGNKKYHLDFHHVGLFWNEGEYEIRYPRLKDLNKTIDKVDMVYYADAKGIMKSQVKTLKEGEADGLEYGGVNNTDYTLCRELIKTSKPVVMECRFLGPPTESLVRYNLEKLTDIYYTGWRGRYISNLSKDKELNFEKGLDIVATYEKLSGENWEFTGPGIVILNDDLSSMVVLQEGVDIETTGGLITSNATGMEKFNVPEAVNYTGCFAILKPGNNTVHSMFNLHPTTSGMEKLAANGLPENFPALIQSDDNFYFLAGDFGKCKVNLFFSRFLGLNRLLSGIKSKGVENPKRFFNTYYQPMMTSIVEEARALKEADE